MENMDCYDEVVDDPARVLRTAQEVLALGREHVTRLSARVMPQGELENLSERVDTLAEWIDAKPAPEPCSDALRKAANEALECLWAAPEDSPASGYSREEWGPQDPPEDVLGLVDRAYWRLAELPEPAFSPAALAHRVALQEALEALIDAESEEGGEGYRRIMCHQVARLSDRVATVGCLVFREEPEVARAFASRVLGNADRFDQYGAVLRYKRGLLELVPHKVIEAGKAVHALVLRHPYQMPEDAMFPADEAVATLHEDLGALERIEAVLKGSTPPEPISEDAQEVLRRAWGLIEAARSLALAKLPLCFDFHRRMGLHRIIEPGDLDGIVEELDFLRIYLRETDSLPHWVPQFAEVKELAELFYAALLEAAVAAQSGVARWFLTREAARASDRVARDAGRFHKEDDPQLAQRFAALEVLPWDRRPVLPKAAMA